MTTPENSADAVDSEQPPEEDLTLIEKARQGVKIEGEHVPGLDAWM